MIEYYPLEGAFFLPAMVLRGPFLVRAFVRVRCPRTGRPLRCRKPPVTADVHQPFDVHADISAKIALYGKFPVDDLANAVELLFGKVADFFVKINARFRAYLP